MGDSQLKEVNFHKYCRKCENRGVKDYDDPCNTCLETGMRKGTEVPTKWKKKDTIPEETTGGCCKKKDGCGSRQKKNTESIERS